MFMVVKEKNRITKFKVSTCSVATASPHWRTLLYGQKRASNEVWSITLDSSPTALDTLFRIVHYEFAKVPTALTVTQLFELSRATSQYGCTQLTYPWIRNWLACCDDLKATAENFDKCHVGIYIAWEFGCLRLFREMTDALIVSTRINDNGDPVNVNGLRLKDMVLPTGLLDTILETRVSTLANMLAAIAKPMQVLSSDERDPAIKYCRVKAHSVECEDQMFGGTMRVLMNKRLNPIPDASTYSGSIMELKKVAEGIKTNPYVGKDWMPHLSHEKCSLRFAEAMEECLKKMPVALHDEYLEHLSNQAYLSGVENGSDMEDYRRRTSDKATSVCSVRVC
ncbi:hypothetical protein F4780DRAFT_153713 [Xylariomycetidae sp. FL0641]|nr:hypothetical protein F4780DRAFT_153713 [Xylariomycetidae sp. FL0641]